MQRRVREMEGVVDALDREVEALDAQVEMLTAAGRRRRW
jgi:hypothetical protein